MMEYIKEGKNAIVAALNAMVGKFYLHLLCLLRV